MRELTNAEIERFDFTGHIPELAAKTQPLRAPVKPSQRSKLASFAAYTQREGNARFGASRPA